MKLSPRQLAALRSAALDPNGYVSRLHSRTAISLVRLGLLKRHGYVHKQGVWYRITDSGRRAAIRGEIEIRELTKAQRQAIRSAMLGSIYRDCRSLRSIHARHRTVNQLIDLGLVGTNATLDGVDLTDAGRAALRGES